MNVSFPDIKTRSLIAALIKLPFFEKYLVFHFTCSVILSMDVANGNEFLHQNWFNSYVINIVNCKLTSFQSDNFQVSMFLPKP